MGSTSRRAVFWLSAPALLLLLAACVEPGPAPQPLPADFVPGGVYDLGPQACAEAGGQITTDGNGLPVCILR